MSPVRTCLGCRQRADASHLLRCTVHDGVVVPDRSGSRPGRGAWVHPTPECVDNSIRRNAFPRALRVAGPLDTTPLTSAVTAGVHELPGQ